MSQAYSIWLKIPCIFFICLTINCSTVFSSRCTTNKKRKSFRIYKASLFMNFRNQQNKKKRFFFFSDCEKHYSEEYRTIFSQPPDCAFKKNLQRSNSYKCKYHSSLKYRSHSTHFIDFFYLTDGRLPKRRRKNRPPLLGTFIMSVLCIETAAFL